MRNRFVVLLVLGPCSLGDRPGELAPMQTFTQAFALHGADPGPGAGDYFPFAAARRAGDRIDNREAPIPVQCYTRTDGVSNPCWTCHTRGAYPNLRSDEELQREYSFSDYGLTNHWTNLFVDRSASIAAISDAEILAWIREDNYSPARVVLEGNVTPWAYPFDLDLAAGFDEDGFARDDSGWRAFRYKPFPGAFWPTNGSTDDVMIRLPAALRPSSMIYRVNLAPLEASLASDPALPDAEVVWPTEPLDENAVGVDLDGDGELEPAISQIRGLPSHWVGDASAPPLVRGTYPLGTEFLHTVRYVDPDAPSMIATRLKELRYLHKEEELPRRMYFSRYAEEADDKDEGLLPRYRGNAETGLVNSFGWRIQGYIEDERGRLRLQTMEEHYACMGCHSSIGVTADSTFAFPRKVPGRAGWRYQDIGDIPDVPQLGHAQPEVLTYFERVGGGDELRANDEVLEGFFVDGKLDAERVRGAATLPELVAPSRARALALDKAYLALVRTQGFTQGRETLLRPPKNVHENIENGSTGLQDARRVHLDGTLRLDWTGTSFWTP